MSTREHDREEELQEDRGEEREEDDREQNGGNGGKGDSKYGVEADGRGEAGRTEQTSDTRRSAAEWTTLIISSLIVMALAGLVIFQAVSGGTEPPNIEVEPQLTEVRSEGDSYYLPLSITNSGDLTGEEVEVEATLTSGEEEETSAVTIAFLAGGETESATAVFSSDPREGELEVRVVGYNEP